MSFDGACAKDGARVGIISISPHKKALRFSFKLRFECTNSVPE